MDPARQRQLSRLFAWLGVALLVEGCHVGRLLVRGNGPRTPGATTAPASRCQVEPAPPPPAFLPQPNPPGTVRQREGDDFVDVALVNGHREGPARLYNAQSSTLSSEGAFHAGLKEGPWLAFRNGFPDVRCEYVAGRRSGTCVRWNVCGQEVEREQWRDEVREGPSVTTHDNGLRAQEATWVRGVRVGAFREWHENGAPKTEGAYASGEKDGLWRTWFANGVLQSEATYRAGLVAGVQRTWFANAQRESEVAVDGSRQEWEQSGPLRRSLDVATGEQREFWPGGAPKHESVRLAGGHTRERYWTQKGVLVVEAELGPSGPVSVQRWDEHGKPISEEEFRRREIADHTASNARWKALMTVLEVPASILLYGLK